MADTDEKVEERKGTRHDFLVENKWLFIIVGYGQSRSLPYLAYIAALFVYLSFFFLCASYGAYLTTSNKGLAISALHVFMDSVFMTWGLITRLITDESLNRTREYIRTGFYKYEGEKLYEDQIKMKEDIVNDVRNKSKKLIYIFSFGGVTSMILYPLSQVIIVTEDQYESSVDLANPYLPCFVYIPFSTRSPLGLATAFFLCFVLILYIYMSAMAINELYLSCVIQLQSQLRILKYSITHVHQRALRMYARTLNSSPVRVAPSDLINNAQYQLCLYRCLRSNIEHHQLLIRYKDEMMKFSGSILLMLALFSPITFASPLYLFMRNPPPNVLVTWLVTLVVEQSFILFMCFYGETILQESGSMFETLYSVEWFLCNKSFNKLLGIFMCFTRKPMGVNALLLDVTASLETYANFMSAVYKIMNLLRQSDI